MKPIFPTFILLGLTGFGIGCASVHGEEAHALDAIKRRYESNLTAFEAEQRKVAATEGIPGVIEFGALGDLHVDSLELVGWPSSAVLRADFTWVNSGKRTRRAPSVRLSIIDEAGDDWRSNSVELGGTFGIEYGSGSTHTTWLRVPTDGLHLRTGWTWGLELLDATENTSTRRRTGITSPSERP